MLRASVFISLGAALGLAMSACTPAPAGPVTIETAKFDPALHVDLNASKRTPTGLYYRDITIGDGADVTPGSTAAVMYTGWLANGTEFDGTRAGAPPYVFQVATGRVIAGWDEGVAGMKVGGKRQLIIPPALGYGAAANGPIPANSILVFTVEVVGVR